MNRADLYKEIRNKGSYLCVGLDTDISKIPSHLRSEPDPIFAFNREIIDATQDLCVAYKPNIAFYEAMGPQGWESLEKTLEYIPKNIFTIADAKRGDIGNTSRKYAETFFSYFDFDAVTVAPYMGADSVEPFLEFTDKWVILLGLTSNVGSRDFQHLISDERPLYEHVIRKAQEWGNPDNLMFVLGATHPERFSDLRVLAEEYFFLVPGVGAQGGSVAEVSRHGYNDTCGLLVNSSRGIIYAGGDKPSFAKEVRHSAKSLQIQMAEFITKSEH